VAAASPHEGRGSQLPSSAKGANDFGKRVEGAPSNLRRPSRCRCLVRLDLVHVEARLGAQRPKEEALTDAVSQLVAIVGIHDEDAPALAGVPEKRGTFAVMNRGVPSSDHAPRNRIASAAKGSLWDK
jgi:hypothetical protein